MHLGRIQMGNFVIAKHSHGKVKPGKSNQFFCIYYHLSHTFVGHGFIAHIIKMHVHVGVKLFQTLDV